MPKPTKAEFIMMFLNQWDPARGADKDYKFYQADAEEIAQQIRKNSTPESVEKVVAAPELREKEKGAWERAMVEKHGKKGGPCHYKAE